jgi:predicted nucleic acid-binding protein
VTCQWSNRFEPADELMKPRSAPPISFSGGIDLLPVDRAVIEQAATVTPNELRSPDAIHLASALSIKAHLTAFIAYDSRLCSAALQAGMTVELPR